MNEAIATAPMRRVEPAAERRFYTGMAIALLVVVAVGFSRSFYLRPLFPDHPAPSEAIFAFHGAAFSAWIVLLVAQTSLVAGARTDLHRRLGASSAALVPIMVVLGVIAAIVAARRTTGFTDVPVPPLVFLAIPLFDMLVFPLLAGAALLRRRDAQAHKRLMLLATISLVTAAIARWPGVLPLGPLVFFGLADLFVLALVAWDFRSRGRLHPATIWGGLLLIASQPIRLAVMGTPAWAAFARWLTSLPG